MNGGNWWDIGNECICTNDCIEYWVDSWRCTNCYQIFYYVLVRFIHAILGISYARTPSNAKHEKVHLLAACTCLSAFYRVPEISMPLLPAIPTRIRRLLQTICLHPCDPAWKRMHEIASTIFFNFHCEIQSINRFFFVSCSCMYCRFHLNRVYPDINSMRSYITLFFLFRIESRTHEASRADPIIYFQCPFVSIKFW